MHSNLLTYRTQLVNEEIATLLEDWKTEFTRPGALALVAEASKDLVAPLQQLFCDHDIPLVGAIFPELIHANEFQREGIILIRFDQMPKYILMNDLLNQDNLANTLADALYAEPTDNSGNDTLFLIFDGMLPNIASVLDGIFLKLADQVKYSGVNAGSETFQPMPCLFDQHTLAGNALLALALPDQPCAILDHSYQAPERMIIATATEGNKITSIDWRPAFEVYTEVVAEQYGVTITPENFYQYGVHFPFGIMHFNTEYLVRIPVALTEDGALYCVGEIPDNALLTLLEAVPPGSSATIDKITRFPADCAFSLVLGFYCAGRRMHLGDAANKELDDWSNRLRPKALSGALSLGEIGGEHQGGHPIFQNACLVSIPWK